MVLWTPYALPGFLAWISFWVAAAWIYKAGPRRTANRWLALVLFLDGAHFAGYDVLRFLVATDPLSAAAVRSLDWVTLPASAFAYLGFLGTVDAPLSDRLDSPRVRNVLLAGVVASFLAWPLYSPIVQAHAMVPVHPPGVDATLWFLGDRPISDVLNGVYMLALFYGLAVAASAYRNAREGSNARYRAKAYLRAFGIRDAVIGSVFVIASLHRVVSFPDWIIPSFSLVVPPAGIAFVILLAYGILKTQLFDIDLKIKWTLEKSTVAAIFVAVFFIVSEGAQVLFADFAGSELLGVVAAGALVFFLAPLQRLGEQVGDAAMPGVEDTDTYREQRKREVYRASVEELMADDEITAKERRMLGRLQEELGLDGGQASRIEADVVEASGGGA